jgi:hypothetical protein
LVRVAARLVGQTAVLVVRLVAVALFQSPKTLPSHQAQPFIAALERVALEQHRQTQAEQPVAIHGSTSSIQRQHQARMQFSLKVAAQEPMPVLAVLEALPHPDLAHSHIQAGQVVQSAQPMLVVVAAVLQHRVLQTVLMVERLGLLPVVAVGAAV